MGAVRNVLFIMADQLRFDHLSCTGHPYLTTPNLDALAKRGVRFANAFVNSGICGPSRMSYYTGRYPISHGATANRVPLSVGEVTLGEYLKDANRTLALTGKTHVLPDIEGLRRFGIEGGTELAHLLGTGGFTELDRYDGHHTPGNESGYPAFLQSQGYDSQDPWNDFVISGVDSDGRVVSGWNMRNVHLPARVREEHSETAYMTDQAIGFMQRMGEQPWVLHLSYVKPHWPYMAPAPYHALYTSDQCMPLIRNKAELENAHPILKAYRAHNDSVSFQNEECARTVRPAYQGLIKQLDDHLGRLFDFMESKHLFNETLIIFCADHGDFLGDHWLAEKELFYDTVQKVPFIVVDPRPEAEVTRGRVEERFIEGVDVVPTILAALGVEVPTQRVEGLDLAALLHLNEGTMAWRNFAYSELDYSFRDARVRLGKSPQQSRAYSIRTSEWRYVYWLDEPEQLFNITSDPNEFQDLGRDAMYEGVRNELRKSLLDFMARRKRRVTMNDEHIIAHSRKTSGRVRFGHW